MYLSVTHAYYSTNLCAACLLLRYYDVTLCYLFINLQPWRAMWVIIIFLGCKGEGVSDYGLDDLAIEVRSPAGAEDFSSSPCVQTGSGAHPANGYRGIFPLGGRDADHSPQSSAEVKYEYELYLLSPHVPPWRVAGQLCFTFFVGGGISRSNSGKIQEFSCRYPTLGSVCKFLNVVLLFIIRIFQDVSSHWK
jgi:hypothetical protein